MLSLSETIHRARALRLQTGRRRARRAYTRRWGFPPPPQGLDLTGYDPILEVIDEHLLSKVEGDVLEVGVLFGGGTYKLASYFDLHAPSKRVIAVDIFDPGHDQTENAGGETMAQLYARLFAETGIVDQRFAYDQVVAGLRNVITVAADSADAQLPTDRLCFAFIDGNHNEAYVRSDFEMVWSRLSPGGIVALHDYGGDLPGVTHTVNALIGENAEEVARVWSRGIVIFILREAIKLSQRSGEGVC